MRALLLGAAGEGASFASVSDFSDRLGLRIVAQLPNLSGVIVEVGDRRLSDLSEASAGYRSEVDVVALSAASVFRLPSSPAPEPATPVSTGIEIGWGLSALCADQLWSAGVRGEGVVIGHIDDGLVQHGCVASAVIERVKFDKSGKLSSDPAALGLGHHGLRTAAIMVGREFQGRAVGMAPASMLVSASIGEADPREGYVLAIERVLLHKPKVVLIEMQCCGLNDDFEKLLQRIRNAGALPVVPIGNLKEGTTAWPGNCAGSLSVGAMDFEGAAAEESSSTFFGRPLRPHVPLVVAPGVTVPSAMHDNAFDLWCSGTSFAAPHVAGLAALLFSAVPEATVDGVQEAILASAKFPGLLSQRRGAFGLPNGLDALQHLRDSVRSAWDES